jgi:ABC-2 type transport system permease protein
MIAKLLKYELLRRKGPLTAFAVIFIVLEGLLLFGLFKGDAWIGLSIFMTILLIGGTYVFVLLDPKISFYSDIKNKHGYMLFLTPVNGYQIVGSKALFGFIQMFVAGAILFLTFVLNSKLTTHLYFTGTEIESLWNRISHDFKDFLPTLGQIIQFLVMVLLQWFNVIMMGIFAITLNKTIFSDNRHSFLLSLLMYVFLYVIIQTVTVAILAPFGLFGDMLRVQTSNGSIQGSLNVGKYTTLGMILNAFYILLFYFLSGRFLHKRVDL